MKVLLMTIQSAPPGLDYDRDKKFSKNFKEMIAMCLVKDQSKRPTAEKLLKHAFFKHAKPPELSVKKLFSDLPPLWDRVKSVQLIDAAQLALKRMPSAEQEAISQSEYKRGVSAWDFDIEDLKAQASLVQDDDLLEIKEGDESIRSHTSTKEDASESGFVSGNLVLPSSVVHGDQVSEEHVNLTQLAVTDVDMVHVKVKSLAAKVCRSQSGPLMPGIVLGQTSSEGGCTSERPEIEIQPELNNSIPRTVPSFSGPLMLPTRASANSLSAPIKSSGGYRDSLDDKSKANLVQIKGRFSVTSENVDLAKGSPLRKSASVGDWIFESKQAVASQSTKEVNNANVSSSLLFPHLQILLHQTAIQQELITSLLNSLQPSEADGCQNGKLPPASTSRSLENGCVSYEAGTTSTAASEKERSLLVKISDLQARMANLVEELSAEKHKYVLLQQQLSAVATHEEDENRIEEVA
ncbi:hypothetical protein RND81_13G061200 [Saponaria officinalis]